MTQVWAHRGASAYAPENTLEAFSLAIEQGADGLELDVHLTADRQLVVLHDETIDRTSDGAGRVAQLTLEALRTRDFSNGVPGYGAVRIPTLAEVFELVRPSQVVLNVEIKNNIDFQPGIEALLVEAVERSGLAERIIVSSFNHPTLKVVQQLEPRLQLGVLFNEIMLAPWEYAAELGATAIHPAANSLQVNGIVELSHAAGMAVHTWTIDRRDHLTRAMQLGVDAVITNRPDVALEVRETHRLAQQQDRRPALAGVSGAGASPYQR